MGNVVISPNIKKVSARVDVNGNEINPVTKQIIPKEPDYIPTIEEIKGNVEKPKANPLAEMIKAQVNKAVQEAIKDIDIASMVKQAMQDAFKV